MKSIFLSAYLMSSVAGSGAAAYGVHHVHKVGAKSHHALVAQSQSHVVKSAAKKVKASANPTVKHVRPVAHGAKGVLIAKQVRPPYAPPPRTPYAPPPRGPLDPSA